MSEDIHNISKNKTSYNKTGANHEYINRQERIIQFNNKRELREDYIENRKERKMKIKIK